MPELDDHSTDKLFQTGAERHDFAYNPDAWDQMEGMLDADLRLWQRKWWLGVLLLVVMAGTAFFLWAETRLEPIDMLPSDKIVAGVVAPAKATDLVDNVNADEMAASTSAVDDEETRSTPVTVITINEAVVVGAQGEADIKVAQRTFLSTTITNAAAKEVTTVGGKPDPAAALPIMNSSAAVLESVTSGRQSSAVLFIPALEIAEVVLNATNRETGADLFLSGPQDFVITSRNSMAVSLGAGLIYGMIDKGEELISQPRYSAGVEYRIGPRFAVGTGLAYSKVCYRSPGAAYDPKGESWVRDVEPTSVLAQCNILEIPLSVKYYLKGSRSNTFYGSAGTVSYLLLKENYDFTYNETASDLKLAWEGKNANNHFLGVAQFSLGFQRQLGGQSSLRLESFIHLPLTGIGQGQTNLLSAGVSMSYAFDFRKRK